MSETASATAKQAPSTGIGFLNVTSDPSPLVITLQDQKLNVVNRSISPARFQVPPGLYVVTATRPGADDLRAASWARAGEERSIHLSAAAPGLGSRISSATARVFLRGPANPQLADIAPAWPFDKSRLRFFSIRFARLYDWRNSHAAAP